MGDGGEGDTGGDTEDDGILGWLGNLIDSLRDWFTSLIGGIGSLAEKVGSIPSLIWDVFKDAFGNVTDFLGWIWDSIVELPSTIIEGLKEIFVPDTDDISSQFNALLDTLKMKFNFNTDFFTSIYDTEMPVTDVNGDYYIKGVGNLRLKFFDAKYVYDGVTYFRPFIRGFIVLLLAFYNVRMVLSFIRQDAGMLVGKSSSTSPKEDK